MKPTHPTLWLVRDARQGSSRLDSDYSDAMTRHAPMCANGGGDHASRMRSYLRNRTAGGTYFFTVNLAKRQGNGLLLEQVDALRAAFRRTRVERPFAMLAWVVLPEHLHCVWRLPAGDDDYASRWRLIKSRFSRAIRCSEGRSTSRLAKSERGIWQRRYWEHLIRDEADLRAHVDYIHFNPVKHGHVARASDWPQSSFHAYVDRGVLPRDWGGEPAALSVGE